LNLIDYYYSFLSESSPDLWIYPHQFDSVSQDYWEHSFRRPSLNVCLKVILKYPPHTISNCVALEIWACLQFGSSIMPTIFLLLEPFYLDWNLYQNQYTWLIKIICSSSTFPLEIPSAHQYFPFFDLIVNAFNVSLSWHLWSSIQHSYQFQH
jgi:hypothetical protein